MAVLCEGGNEPASSLKAICKKRHETFPRPKKFKTQSPASKSIKDCYGVMLLECLERGATVKKARYGRR
ncbi:hypothetical protein ANN_06770 [Periplaneta americana]|uniref:Uncharacterized protein n=1 Tax=Periplaneta americana TaxID=6978 RepID=A0ABQ8TEF4_PERAM|nr:hypothetical protein ANN_06770 [Periplaneta americana]